MTRNNSQEAQNQINTKMTSTLKNLSETVKHLGYDIREVRDGVARSSNAGSGTSKTPQTYTGNFSELWEELDELFKEKKRVRKVV